MQTGFEICLSGFSLDVEGGSQVCAENDVLKTSRRRQAGGRAEGDADFKGASEGEGAALSDGGFCLLRCSLSPLSTASLRV